MGRLQTARLENFIRRWGSIKGPGSVLSETLGDVFPVLDLENIAPESMFLAGKKLWGAHSFATGGAGQNAGVQVENPANSGVLVVITSMFVRPSIAMFCTWGTNANALFTGGGAGRRGDTRSTGAFLGGVNVRNSTNANTEFMGRAFLIASPGQHIVKPDAIAVLRPGTNFTVVTETNATVLACSFAGYLREAEASELSF